MIVNSAKILMPHILAHCGRIHLMSTEMNENRLSVDQCRAALLKLNPIASWKKIIDAIKKNYFLTTTLHLRNVQLDLI